MRFWAKLSTFGVVYFFISVIWTGIVLLATQRQALYGGLDTMLAFTTFSGVLGIVTWGIPIFYYGWIKNLDNEGMKLWSKIATILLLGYAFFGFINPYGLKSSDTLSILPTLIVMVPLFYFAWRRKNG